MHAETLNLTCLRHTSLASLSLRKRMCLDKPQTARKAHSWAIGPFQQFGALLSPKESETSVSRTLRPLFSGQEEESCLCLPPTETAFLSYSRLSTAFAANQGCFPSLSSRLFFGFYSRMNCVKVQRRKGESLLFPGSFRILNAFFGVAFSS